MTSVPIIRLQCFSCSRFLSPHEIIRIGESVIKCWDCYQKHAAILESWDEPPSECARCRVTFAKLAERTPGQPVSMFLHEIDGTLGLLCAPCDKAYVMKRPDLFAKTRFGWKRKVR